MTKDVEVRDQQIKELQAKIAGLELLIATQDKVIARLESELLKATKTDYDYAKGC